MVSDIDIRPVGPPGLPPPPNRSNGRPGRWTSSEQRFFNLAHQVGPSMDGWMIPVFTAGYAAHRALCEDQDLYNSRHSRRGRHARHHRRHGRGSDGRPPPSFDRALQIMTGAIQRMGRLSHMLHVAHVRTNGSEGSGYDI